MVKTPHFHAGGMGLILGPGTKILHALWWPERIHNIFFYKGKRKEVCERNESPTLDDHEAFQAVLWNCFPPRVGVVMPPLLAGY